MPKFKVGDVVMFSNPKNRIGIPHSEGDVFFIRSLPDQTFYRISRTKTSRDRWSVTEEEIKLRSISTPEELEALYAEV